MKHFINKQAYGKNIMVPSTGKVYKEKGLG